MLSENARLEISSTCGWDNPGNHARLFVGDKVDFAFHTDKEKNPWAKLNLGAVKTVRNIVIENRANERRTDGLILSISHDGQKWEEIWRAKTWETTWVVPVTHVDAGHDIPGRPVRFIRMETKNEEPRELLLRRITVFGTK